MDVYERMKDLGISLPKVPSPGGVYSQVKKFGSSFCYISGTGPNVDGKVQYSGKLGETYTLEQGRETARSAVLNMLAILQKNIGDLNRVKRFVKLLCFVASANDFYSQPEVANGASQLLVDIFGESVGNSARSAVGMNALPGNIPFEIEAIVELN